MLRATRQYVETLVTGSGDARVTRQYVDVLIETTVQNGIATDSLGIGDSALGFAVKVVETPLGVADVASAGGIWGRSGVDDVGLVQLLDVRGPIYQTVTHHLGLTTPTIGHLGVQNVAASSTLNLIGHRAGRMQTAEAASTLALVATIYQLNTGSHTLALVDTAQAGKGKWASDELVFRQAALPGALLHRSITTALAIRQSGTYQLSGPSLKQYHPFVGFGGDAPDTTPPTLGEATLTLTYPVDVPTSTVVLRNPEFGNRDRVGFNRINRQTRGGTLIVYADSAWPKTQTLQVQVSGLRQAQANDFLAFVEESLGKEVGLLDHENRQWRGLLLNPDAPVSNPERGEYTVSFEFEGELC